ncbi:iron donor protein CyaY [Denitrificimonas sp. JX-1]|uniref:Iron-sulfur cluster assembly protein CyaY n=1 Tax=Denitrificimonas halotolerans TaxID=3098930 RepID=A0ABU5GP72_9GAMM|nr:iron donor protein CyaY [Denitrificimonas sp. JX-1]MDY7218312.1 iron donor protein CyaY [Denitrificimonas sp. JX-1]
MSLNNSQFHDLVDRTQRDLEDIIDNGDADIDLESSAGILTLTFENQHQVILSRQEPLKQLWLADRSGGFHFDYDSEQNTWVCSGTQQTLAQMLSEILLAHTQEHFDLSSL